LMMSYFVDIVATMKASVSSSAGGARVVGAFESRAKQRARHRAWRIGGLAVAGLLAFAPISSMAEHAYRGMVRYDHPVFRNGKRVLWHGAWRAAGAKTRVAAVEPEKPAPAPEPKPPVTSPDREITVIAEAQDDCASRMAGELVETLRAAGLKAHATASATSPDALAKAVIGDTADLAIAPMDALLANYKATASWRDRAPYVARLANEAIEIVALRTVADLGELKKLRDGSGPVVVAQGASADALLARLGLGPKLSDESLAASLDDLAAGKIDAVAVVGAGQSPAFANFGKDGRFHLLSIPWTPALRGAYAPARLTSKDRPNLIRADEKVDAVAAPMALIAIDAGQSSPRAPQFAAVVSAFFQKFDALLAKDTDANWREVNLAASANWPRLPAAQQWIAGGQGMTDASLDAFRKMAHSVASASGGPGAADADKLYESLMQWRGTGP
jgi:TRAP-type uncharacterized transport system substrate-binding protein